MNCAVLRLCPEMAGVQILATLMVTVLKEAAIAFLVFMAMIAESVEYLLFKYLICLVS